MTDKPILFSAPMIRALLDGRKTQERRVLKPQPKNPVMYGERYLNRYSIGDRLWVREAFLPRGLGLPISAIMRPHYRADPESDKACWKGLWKPSIHMPRRYSRLTLIVTDVRVQRLQEISEEDAIADGIETDIWDMAPVARRYGTEGWFVGWSMGLTEPSVSVEADEVYRRSFQSLWNSINGPDAWDANPWVVVYGFEVHKCNIDAMEPQG